MTALADRAAVRAEVEDFLYREAELLDAWRLDDWLALLTEDARYEVPSNDAPDGDSRDTLFLIADDITRIRARVKRLKSPDAHAEWPRSRTRRLIANVRVLADDGETLAVGCNFVVWRFRRDRPDRAYVGHYRYRLARRADGLWIRERRAVLDGEALGELGAVSFIL